MFETSVNQGHHRLSSECAVVVEELKPQLSTTARGSASLHKLYNHKTNVQYRVLGNFHEQEAVITLNMHNFWCNKVECSRTHLESATPGEVAIHTHWAF